MSATQEQALTWLRRCTAAYMDAVRDEASGADLARCERDADRAVRAALQVGCTIDAVYQAQVAAVHA